MFTSSIVADVRQSIRLCVYCIESGHFRACESRENPYISFTATFSASLTFQKRSTMTELLKQIAEFIKPDDSLQEAPGVAQHLMERAEADAGRNPVEAEELRTAARAFLSVVR